VTITEQLYSFSSASGFGLFRAKVVPQLAASGAELLKAHRSQLSEFAHTFHVDIRKSGAGDKLSLVRRGSRRELAMAECNAFFQYHNAPGNRSTRRLFCLR